MRKFFKRTAISAGKFSIPVWAVIAALLMTTVALGAWFFVVKPFALSVDTGSGLSDSDITLYSEGGTVETDAAPAGLVCDYVAGEFAMSSATPGDRCEFAAPLTNNGSLAVYIAPIDGADISTLAPEFILEDTTCGTLVAASGGAGTARFILEMTDQSQPSSSYGPFDLDWNFDVAAPTCP